MNRKQLVILLVLLLVLGAAGLLIQRGRDQAVNPGGSEAGRKLLGEKFPINDVTRLTFKEGTNELNLVRKDDLWRVRERSDYPANFAMISEFLIKAADLKVVQSEQVGASQLAGLQLSPPGPGTNGGVAVELLDKNNKALKTLILGKMHMRKPAKASPSPFGDEGFPDGRYVMLSGEAQKVLLVADPLNSAGAKPGPWLDKEFFKVDRPQSVAVTYPVSTNTNSWKLERESEIAAWKLADAGPEENLDTNKLYGVTAPFGSASFNDVLPSSAKPEDNGLDQPTVIAIHTFDDFNYTVKVGKKSGEDYPMTVAVTANLPKERTPPADEKPEDKDKAEKTWKDHQKLLEDKLKQAKKFENWTYLVSNWTLDSILKERKDLLAEKKEEPKPADKAEPAAEKKDDIKSPGTPAAGTDKQ